MTLFFRFLAVVICFLALTAGVLFQLGGKVKEVTSNITIEGTDVATVMSHLSDPQLVSQWAGELVEMQPDRPDSKQTTITIQDEQGTEDLQSRFLHSTDSSITVKTSSDSFDAVSIWRVESRGENDVQIRQLMLGRHRGFQRLAHWFRPDQSREIMQEDLERLKSFIETGSPGRNSASDESDPGTSDDSGDPEASSKSKTEDQPPEPTTNKEA